MGTKPALTPAQIAEVRRLKESEPKLTNKAIAERFGVGETTIKIAVRGMHNGIAAPDVVAPAAASSVIAVPLERLIIGDLNPRKTFDEEALLELEAEIEKDGVLQNLVVRPANEHGAHEVIAGERRVRALRRLAAKGVWNKPVPCLVKAVDVAGHLVLALVENILRQDVPPIEEADAFARLQDIDKDKWSTAEIAARIGKTQRYVQQRLQLARNLGHEARAALADKLMAMDAARAMCRLSFDQQVKFFEEHRAAKGKENISSDDVSDFIRWSTNLFFVVYALFDVASSGLETEVFDDDEVFSDTEVAMALQMREIEARKKEYLEKGYAFVTVMPHGAKFPFDNYTPCKDKAKGAGVVVTIDNEGEVEFILNLVETRPELPLLSMSETGSESASATPARTTTDKPFASQPDRHPAIDHATPDMPAPSALQDKPGQSLHQTFLDEQKRRHERVLLFRDGDYEVGATPDPACETCKDFAILQYPGGTIGYGVCLNPKSARAGLMTYRTEAGSMCHSSLGQVQRAADVDAKLY